MVLIPSAIIGIVCAIVYSWQCWSRQRRFDVGVLTVLFMNSAGLVAGVFLVISVFSPDLRERLNSIDLYILIGGAAVLAVSLL
jgi:hypothetical protein